MSKTNPLWVLWFGKFFAPAPVIPHPCLLWLRKFSTDPISYRPHPSWPQEYLASIYIIVLCGLNKPSSFIFLYLGLGPTLVSIAPFLAIQQCVYDVLKNVVIHSAFSTTSVPTFLVCGAFAGTLAQTVCSFPYELLFIYLDLISVWYVRTINRWVFTQHIISPNKV